MNQTAQEIFTETRQLTCQLTDQEKQELGESISVLILDHSRIELEKKETTKAYNEKLKHLMKVIKRQSYLVNKGEEQRQITCEVNWNDPVPGVKKIVRRDTYEDWNEDMTPDEINLFTQPEISFEDAEDKMPWSWEEE